MITTQMLRTSLPLVLAEHSSNHSSLGRLFAAAVVNYQFRDLLLQDPQRALQSGYQGESFSLTKEEQDLIISIRADTLADLASHVTKTLYK